MQISVDYSRVDKDLNLDQLRLHFIGVHGNTRMNSGLVFHKSRLGNRLTLTDTASGNDGCNLIENILQWTCSLGNLWNRNNQRTTNDPFFSWRRLLPMSTGKRHRAFFSCRSGLFDAGRPLSSSASPSLSFCHCVPLRIHTGLSYSPSLPLTHTHTHTHTQIHRQTHTHTHIIPSLGLCLTPA